MSKENRVSDERLAEMIAAMGNHGAAKLATIYTADYLAAITELQSLRSKPVAGVEEAFDEDEAYEIGKRDGYEQAVQDIDRMTGGDGEYRYVMGAGYDDERHTPDAETMKLRIADRFSALLPKATAPVIETRNDEAGFVEFLNEDVWTVTREIDGRVAIMFDANTRQVVGYRVYDPAIAPVVSERREIETEAEALQRLADGDRIVYSRDGEAAWFQNGDRAFVDDVVILDLHLSGLIETLNDGEDEDWHEWSQITDKGRAALTAALEARNG